MYEHHWTHQQQHAAMPELHSTAKLVDCCHTRLNSNLGFRPKLYLVNVQVYSVHVSAFLCACSVFVELNGIIELYIQMPSFGKTEVGHLHVHVVSFTAIFGLWCNTSVSGGETLLDNQ